MKPSVLIDAPKNSLLEFCLKKYIFDKNDFKKRNSLHADNFKCIIIEKVFNGY
jgi:hypothetical protein